MKTGLITSAFGRHYQLELDDGKRLLAHPRSKKSSAVVGDVVQWLESEDEAVIEKIIPRRNLLYRQDEVRTKAFAANLDQVLIMIAAEPEFSQNQLTRSLIAAQAEQIDVLIVLNKSDLTHPFEETKRKLQPYQKMGYHIVYTSLYDTTSAKQLLPLLQQKTTLVMGASGTGKSTLINALIPDAHVQTGELSKALKSGKHTTTTSQWYWLPEHQGAIIDSPGFQEFGLHHIAPEQLAQLMPDLREYASQCRFYNCTHLHEPGCGVIKAVETGEISETRYQLYKTMMQDALNAPKY